MRQFQARRDKLKRAFLLRIYTNARTRVTTEERLAELLARSEDAAASAASMGMVLSPPVPTGTALAILGQEASAMAAAPPVTSGLLPAPLPWQTMPVQSAAQPVYPSFSSWATTPASPAYVQQSSVPTWPQPQYAGSPSYGVPAHNGMQQWYGGAPAAPAPAQFMAMVPMMVITTPGGPMCSWSLLAPSASGGMAYATGPAASSPAGAPLASQTWTQAGDGDAGRSK